MAMHGKKKMSKKKMSRKAPSKSRPADKLGQSKGSTANKLLTNRQRKAKRLKEIQNQMG